MNSESGRFRVSLRFENEGDDGKTYFVFIDTNLLKTVGDLERHIKSTFTLAEDVTLLVDQCVLPRNESIAVLFPTDVLRVRKNTIDKANIFDERNIDDCKSFMNTGKSAKKTKKCITLSVGSALKALRPNGCSNLEPSEKKIIDNNNQPSSVYQETQPETFDIQEVSTCSEKKEGRKRKRKHLKKKKTNLEESTEQPAVLPVVQASTSIGYEHTASSTPRVPNHSYFSSSDEMEIIEENLVNGKDKNKIETNLPNKTDDSANGDNWGAALLRMSKRSLSDKTFSRPCRDAEKQNKSSDIAKMPFDIDSLEYPVVDDVKEKDIISFKILKLGADYCPIMSGNIVAEVKEIKSESQIVVEIMHGEEEFGIPDGKLSFEDITNRCHKGIVELNRNEMLETRLIFP